MGSGQSVVKKRLLDNCLNWFQSHFKQYVENRSLVTYLRLSVPLARTASRWFSLTRQPQ